MAVEQCGCGAMWSNVALKAGEQQNREHWSGPLLSSSTEEHPQCVNHGFSTNLCVSPQSAKARQGLSLQATPPMGVCSHLTVLFLLKSSQTALGVLHGEKSPNCSPQAPGTRGAAGTAPRWQRCPGSLSVWLRKLLLLPLFTPPHQSFLSSLRIKQTPWCFQHD